MSNKSFRIRTTPGVSKNISLKIEQDFDFLEILSLKIAQENLYKSFCAGYGTIVGRVISNGGFGIPNAKVSIFVPITDEDQNNVFKQILYPYKTPYDKNSEGIRYNLFPKEPKCDLNVGIGSFPSKEEVLEDQLILEIFDTYYKYTTRTNEAGDYMIFGVPTGQQNLHIDVDLSDIGIASIRPYDLIAQGSPERLFDSKVLFKKSTNLQSLPQVKTLDTTVDVIPFWGDVETCDIGITRVDFDTTLNLTYTSLFFGSVFTDAGRMNLQINCNPRNSQGEQDKLTTGSGRIRMIRVAQINQSKWADETKIQPIELEDFDIEGGQLIDDDGNFAFTVPMNICNVVTNEFGQLVASGNPDVGIATKGMYRFAMSFNGALEGQSFRTATMFFPSLNADVGGTKGVVDTGDLDDANGTQDQRFTTDITQYNNASSVTEKIVAPVFDDLPLYSNSRIDKDFHLFEWRQVYTIAHYIKKYKKGANRFSFLGLKNTDATDASNPLPYSNAIYKFDILYFILSAALEVFTFLVGLLLFLALVCFGFCFRFTILKITIGLCFSVCPLNFLSKLIKKITLPVEDCGGADKITINLNSCGAKTGYCGPQKLPVRVSRTSPNCPPPRSINGGRIPADDNITNVCLDLLAKWKCCVRFALAEDRKVIRRVFNDAWLIGSAYLFQFKYKKKIKRRTGVFKKEKFCGPGSSLLRADNYLQNGCCPETKQSSSGCRKCLLRGAAQSNDSDFWLWVAADPGKVAAATSVVGLAILYQQYLQNPGQTVFGKYQKTYHNIAVSNGKVGSADIDDIIYCNALMPTKIISLGRVEACPDVITEIENAINESDTLDSYSQNPDFYIGTYYEKGWDNNLWVQQLPNTSYKEPTEVLQYLLFNENGCNVDDLFDRTQGCHEFELKADNYFWVKEVSKIYNDIETTPITSQSNVFEEFKPDSIAKPIADLPNLDAVTDPILVDSSNPFVGPYSGFVVDLDTANRFSPCGKIQCTPLHSWDGGTTWLDMGSTTTGDYSEISNNVDAFDYSTSPSTRNNRNTRANATYFYFGIRPGKTALDKLRNNYFTIPTSGLTI